MVLIGPVLSDKVRYCERFLELVIDLEALLPTRRFFNTVMDDNHLVVRCQLSNLLHRPEGSLFGQVSCRKMFAKYVCYRKIYKYGKLNNLIYDIDSIHLANLIFLSYKKSIYYIDINIKHKYYQTYKII